MYIYIYTSSTAQGGGGSFKNRKPIGEVGCCESGMAERSHWWTERCLRSPFFRSLSLTIYLPTYLFSMYLSIYRSIYLSLSFFHSITQSIYLSTYLSIYLIYLSIYFQKWSEHGVFCTFWLGNVLPATTAYTFSTSEPPKVVRAWCVLYILTSKCASRHNCVHFFDISTSKSGPSMVCFVHFDLEMCFAPQRRALFRHLNFQKWSENGVFCTFWLRNVLRATTACTFSTSQLPKVVRAWCVLYILTWKCASRHNGVHFFDISTSKTGPRMVCFVHFDLEMCFAPQRRTLFQHLNFQKWSGAEVFCTFWLAKVLRATTAYTFSTSQLPKVVRSWGVLYILTCKCASRHNGVQFFISHLASWLRTRRFSEPTFRPSGASNHWKNTVFRDFPTFSRICIFFLLTLSLLIFSLLIFLFSLPLPCSAFHLSILSEVWLLNFLR